jgi:(E)-4-hydroxy-3-methylbut-2-enyl-diphosphate synthase
MGEIPPVGFEDPSFPRNGKGQIFVNGQVIKTVPEHKIVDTLIEEAMRIAEEAGETPGTGSPVDSVS